jgi:hypothetical protein
MEQDFPPQSDRKNEIEAIASIFNSVMEGRSAYYVSTPMTTGKGLVEPQVAAAIDTPIPGSLREHQKNMIHCNHTYVRKLVHELRGSLASPVINPTAITGLPGWTQSDYRVLSEHVIEHHVHTVIFVDGWQYSLGCSYEFLAAQRTGAKTVTHKLKGISITEGIRLICEAVNELEKTGKDGSFLKAVTRELECCR